VRDSEPACPFCAAPLSPVAAGAGPRRRMNRAALFAAGATLAGVSGCSSSMPLVDHTDAAVQDGTATGGAGGQSGADGAAGGQAGRTVIAIYSAAFPPADRG